MRSTKRKSPFLAGNRIVVLLTALMLAAGLTATTAIAAGDATVAKKKKKKRCPAGTHKVVIKKKKNGRIIKKKKCVPNATNTPTTPPAPLTPTAVLTISPTSFVYPEIDHGTCNGTPADNDCTFQAFTVTNTGGASSGALNVSVTDLIDPVADDGPSFTQGTNTCTSALPPGGSCVVTYAFTPTSNAGDGHYVSQLNVSGTPGGTVQATLDGTTSD